MATLYDKHVLFFSPSFSFLSFSWPLSIVVLKRARPTLRQEKVFLFCLCVCVCVGGGWVGVGGGG